MDPPAASPRPGAAPSPAPPAAAADPSSPMTTAHLARFEFSDQGTKVLMVEWQPGADAKPDDPAGAGPADADADADADAWEVSWPGKSTFVPARDPDHDHDQPSTSTSTSTSPRRRVYFLLPPQAAVPATVTISRRGGSGSDSPPLEIKPLPAIFPDGFDAEPGTRGVLHTIWAKKRVSELQREIEAEMRANAESIGLEMAVAEKQFIIDTFLAPPTPPKADAADAVPRSPRSPAGGRLGDKLKGLRLATSPADLAPSPTANTFTGSGSQSVSLSPQGGDIAVSSFSAISRGPGAAMSLDAAVNNEPAPRVPETVDNEDELFALPISPRSPDMKKSPFSTL